MAYKKVITNADIGTGANQVATGNHNHDSIYVKKAGDTMTGNLKVGSSSIGANGYIEGTWLKTTSATSKAGKFATIDDAGWIYYRTAADARQDMGLSTAMHFIGKATVAITDGSTTDPVIDGYTTKTAGDVIIDKDNSYEYVWTLDGKWERLGPDGSYALSNHTHDYLPLAGGTLTGDLWFADSSNNNCIRLGAAGYSDYELIEIGNSTNRPNIWIQRPGSAWNVDNPRDTNLPSDAPALSISDKSNDTGYGSNRFTFYISKHFHESGNETGYGRLWLRSYANKEVQLKGIYTPEEDTDATNKSYVDNQINETNTKITRLQNEELSKYVKKSGDTISGNLTITRDDLPIIGLGTDDSNLVVPYASSSDYNYYGLYDHRRSKWILNSNGINASFYGNADTASKWATARTITIGATSKAIDGSSDVSWSLSEIGAAQASHNHNSLYVAKSGDTMTGLLKTNGSIENQGEAKFTHPTYCANIEDTFENIGCAFKASRGHFNQMNVNEIYLPATATTNYEVNKISFKSYTGGANGQYTGATEVASLSTTNFTVNGNIIAQRSSTSDINVRVSNSNGAISLLSSTNRGLYDYTNKAWIVYHKNSDNKNYFNGLATQATQDKNGLQIDTNYLKLSGGTMSGKITFKMTTATPAKGTRLPVLSGQYQNGSGTYYSTDLIDLIGTGTTGNIDNPAVRVGSTKGATFITSGEGGAVFPSKLASSWVDSEHTLFCSDNGFYFWGNVANDGSTYTSYLAMQNSKITAYQPLYGAVWNDYAEFRNGDTIEPGRCVVEVGDDTLTISTKRMIPGANITSDTFGFSIGETDECKTPIAVSGRVLAYPYESREEFRKNIGRPVCSGPNGTISIMTDEEYRDKGYCAIGTISAVPDYEKWGSGNVKVDGRIWIKVF